MPDQTAPPKHEEGSEHPVDWRALKLIVSDLAGESELSVWLDRANSTVGDLLDLTGRDRDVLVAIDGERHAITDSLDATELRHGSTVRIEDRSAVRLPPTELPVLECLAGLDTGRRIHLNRTRTRLRHEASGEVVAETTQDTDIAASVVLEVDDNNRVIVAPEGEPAVLGSSLLERATPLEHHVLNLGSVRLCDRPRRLASMRRPPPGPRVVPLPLLDPHPPASRPGIGAGAEPFGFFTAASTTPLALLGLVHPLLALAGCIGPMVAFGQWMDSRSRAAENDDRSSGTIRAIADFGEQIRHERRNEELRRMHAHIGPSDLAELVARTPPREPITGQQLKVPLAMGADHTWFPALDSNAIDTRVVGVLTNNTNLLSVPIDVDLATGPLKISGDDRSCAAVVQWIVASLALRFQLGDQRLVIESPDLEPWGWIHWLDRVELRHGASLSLWLEPDPPRRSAERRLLASVGPITDWRTHLRLDPDGLCEIVASIGASPLPDLTPIGISETTALDLVRRAARVSNQDGRCRGLPLSTAELLDLPASAPDQVDRWNDRAVDSVMTAIIGVDERNRPVEIPIDDGIILPAEGAALADTLCLSLASRYPPERLGLVPSHVWPSDLALALPHCRDTTDVRDRPSLASTPVILHRLSSTALGQSGLQRLCSSGAIPLVILETPEVQFWGRIGTAMPTRVRRAADGVGFTIASRQGVRRLFPLQPGIVRSAGGARQPVEARDQWSPHVDVIVQASLEQRLEDLDTDQPAETEDVPSIRLAAGPIQGAPTVRRHPPTGLGAFEQF